MVELGIMLAIVVGLSEVVKRMSVIPPKCIPILDLILGISASFIWTQGSGWRDVLLQGVIVGLMASGLYSGAKNVLQEIRK